MSPLWKKLGLKPGNHVFLYNEPKEYFGLIGEISTELEIHENPAKESLDFIHLFVKNTNEFELQSLNLKPALKKSGMMWISWPKGKSGVQTDLKREPIRSFLLNNGLVDVKVASVNDIWSGLKFVYRLKDR